MPKHQDALQFRAAGDGGRDPRVSLQFVRKLSGFTRPSKANEAAFERAVDKVAEAARELLASLVTNAPPRDRDTEAAKARAKSLARFRSSTAMTPIRS